MLEFIIEYWVQWLLGIVALGITAVARHYYKLYKDNKQRNQDDYDKQIQQNIEAGMQQTTDAILEKINSLKNNIKDESKKQYGDLVEKLNQQSLEASEKYRDMFIDLNTNLMTFKNENDSKDVEIQEDLSTVHANMNILQKGILNIQGRTFKKECRQLLKPDHVITENEYEDIYEDHDIYNSLGGNHKGDELFVAVDTKYKKSL